MEQLDRNLLIIAYLFPPIAGIGVQRPFAFTKYLQQFGWNPTVLTVDNGYSVGNDALLLRELPDDIAIYRAKDPVNLIQHTLRRDAKAPSEANATNKNNVDHVNHSITEPTARITAKNSRSLIGALKPKAIKQLKVLKQWLCMPDEHVFWVFSALSMARKIIKEHNIQSIYTTSGPHSTHLVGYWLKKWTGLPWIADFRDPWTQNMHYQPSFVRSRIESTMERCVMQNADIVLTVTQSFAQAFQSKYKGLETKLAVIHNGFDALEFQKIPAKRSDDRFTIFYAGILYEKRSPRHFLEGLKLALDRGDLERDQIVAVFAGVFDYPGRTENQDLVRELGLSDVVRVEGYLSHQETVARMKGSDLLLLIGDVDEQAGQYIPGKVFEYIGAQRPILSLTVPGEVSSIISKYGLGRVVPPTNAAAIADGLVNCYHSYTLNQSAYTSPRVSDFRIFDRFNQTQQFSRLLNGLIDAPDLQNIQVAVQNEPDTTAVR